MKLNIGVAGFGTIGSGVVKLLKENGSLIAGKIGVELNLYGIADLDFSADRGVDISGIKQYDDAMKMAEDPDIDIFVELIGGIDFPKKVIIAALKNGKHVVTANKAMLAEKGCEIYKAAEENSVDIGIEASVGGGIPIIKAIKSSLVGNKITEVAAIINGTCNYILTKMSEEGMAFDDALKKAQELGFAEADPELDISGGDAAHKIAIIASIIYNTKVNYDDIYVEGITDISKSDVLYAADLGYNLKLLAIAKDKGTAGFEARVHPTLVLADDQLSAIRNEYNAVKITGDYLGVAMLTGKGAGSAPTASAVVGDLIDIALKLHGEGSILPFFVGQKERRLVPIEDTENRYYLNFSTLDKPGILAKISGILGDRGISIASLIQREAEKDEEFVHLIILTHHAKEEFLRAAVAEIDKIDDILKKTVVIRAI